MSYDIGTSAVTAVSVILSGLIAGQMLAIALANHAARKLPESLTEGRLRGFVGSDSLGFTNHLGIRNAVDRSRPPRV